MKKIMVFSLFLILALSVCTHALSAERIHQSASIDYMDEEVIDGIMTGNKVKVGSGYHDVAYYYYNKPSLTAGPTGMFGVSGSISNKVIINHRITFRLNVTYRQQAYVYMGGFSAIDYPRKTAYWGYTIPE